MSSSQTSFKAVTEADRLKFGSVYFVQDNPDDECEARLDYARGNQGRGITQKADNEQFAAFRALHSILGKDVSILGYEAQSKTEPGPDGKPANDKPASVTIEVNGRTFIGHAPLNVDRPEAVIRAGISAYNKQIPQVAHIKAYHDQPKDAHVKVYRAYQEFVAQVDRPTAHVIPMQMRNAA